MRILEIVFVSLLSIEIVILIFKLYKVNQVMKYFIFLPLVSFALHLLMEGYRWQMLPAYFLLLLLIMVLINRIGRGNKWIVAFRNTTLVIVLVLSIFIPLAFPVLHFSNEGEYNVGVKIFQVHDPEREEIMTDDPNDYREVTVRLFYPTLNEADKLRYIPDFKSVKYTYIKKLDWPLFLIDYIKYFSIEASNNSPIIRQEKFPLIIYSHGLTNNYTEATGRMMKIASRGYIVAAINHSYGSDHAILSDGKEVGYKTLSNLGDPLEFIDSVKTVIANQWVHDAKSVIDHLSASEDSLSIDFNNIGLTGFSAGGTMAVLGGVKIDNVKAVVNLDGTPRGLEEYSVMCPQLFLYSEPVYYTDAQISAWGITREMIDAPIRLINDRSEKILSNAPHPSYLIQIPGTEHSNFIEYPLISPYNQILGIGGSIDARKCYKMINEMIISFLDSNLKNKATKFPDYNLIDKRE